MFDYNKEVIINSDTFDDGTPRFEVKTEVNGVEKLYVYRNGEYDTSKIINAQGQAGHAGIPARLKVYAPEEAGIYRFTLSLGLENKYMSDYAHPWSEFNKVIVAEFEGVGGENADEINAQALAKAFTAALPNNYKVVAKVEANSGAVDIILAEPYQVVNESATSLSVLIEGDNANPVYEVIPEKVDVYCSNYPALYTGKWLRENLRFPTASNTRYEGLNSDETPIQNEVYTMFTFQYAVPLRGLHGQGCVGQAMSSVTTHTFYVLGEGSKKADSPAKAFATALGISVEGDAE